jgi:APA family basic amino acid/polyamine antiporter
VSVSESPALKRVLGAAGLTSLGIGGVIGTGIFVMVGPAAKDIAGPGVVVSFLIAALACGCAALCYARLAARYPEAGSAYAYARALAPPWLAWLIGWNLIAQYVFAAASIGQGWSHYFQDALLAVSGGRWALPTLLRGAGGAPPGAWIDLPALVAVSLVTLLLLRGISPSVRVNHAIVVLKLAVVVLILGVGAFFVRPENWQPLAPFGWGGLLGTNGGGPPRGILAGAAIVFYAYLGFEALTNYSEESHAPRRDVPRGIVRSLAICTVLYMAMALVMTGMVRYDRLSPSSPISEAFGQVGLPWMRTLVAAGALAAISSVLLVILLSLPRILLAIGRDGIFKNRPLGRVDPHTGVPTGATRLSGLLVGVLTALVPLDKLGVIAILANMLTFIAVALLALKTRRLPEEASPAPGMAAPVVTIGMCVLLLLSLPPFGAALLAGWLAVGATVYAVRTRRPKGAV